MTAPLTYPLENAAELVPGPGGVFLLRTRRQRQQRALVLAAMAGLCVIAIVAAVLFALGRLPGGSAWGSDDAAGGRVTLPRVVQETAPIYSTEVMPLAPEEASAINAERPVDVTALVPAPALSIARESAAGVGYGAALRCLTQAVYYEAASEPDEGQRAVAQVVLNRVRHPAFPDTVCGVVYQGSERVTGCQFSFTCDGSLARVPSQGGWARAERVAREALAGRVAAAVGNATHYHANYVVPYWAPTLDKAATVGAHIFYLMRGFMGSPRAFTDRYDVTREVLQTGLLVAPGAATLDPLAVPDPLVPASDLGPDINAPKEDLKAGGLITGSSVPGLEWNRPTAVLRADETRGQLKAPSTGTLRVDSRSPPADAPPPAGAEKGGP
ncbi:cell wall hydrolase [Qipengyuania sediminis]|uniref:cell wall hydrolase n=1 Tax=Qipengyuania sediminis TaxID=1532023 RepID=UPI001F104E22|nr:cell wall hydrolase [Qipengyuania sediminis]